MHIRRRLCSLGTRKRERPHLNVGAARKVAGANVQGALPRSHEREGLLRVDRAS